MLFLGFTDENQKFFFQISTKPTVCTCHYYRTRKILNNNDETMTTIEKEKFPNPKWKAARTTTTRNREMFSPNTVHTHTTYWCFIVLFSGWWWWDAHESIIIDIVLFHYFIHWFDLILSSSLFRMKSFVSFASVDWLVGCDCSFIFNRIFFFVHFKLE